MKTSRAFLLLVVLAALGALLWWLFATQTAPDPTGPHTAAVTDAEADPRPTSRAPLRLGTAEVEADPASRHGILEGRVLCWASGKGVANAELTFLHQGSHSIISSADGAFRFEAAEPGRYELAAVTARGFLPFAPAWGHSPVAFIATPGARVTGIVIYMTPAILYQGTVVDPDRIPVGGATVRVLHAQAAELMLLAEQPEIRSDARGRFEISAPDNALVEATHPDYGPGRARIDFPVQVSRQLIVRLTPKSEVERHAISGLVLAPTGEPLEGALLCAEQSPEIRGQPGSELAPVRWALSGDDGRFEIDRLDPGRYEVLATHAGCAPARAVVLSGTRDVKLQLLSEGAVQGSVRDAQTGEPVVAFTILVGPAVHTRGMLPTRHASVFNAEGEYEIRGLAPGRHRVQAIAHGFAPSDETDIMVSTAKPAQADFELTRGSRIFGLVLDEQTRLPLEGARVSAEAAATPGDAAVPVLASTLTGASGAFELRGMGKGQQALVAAASGHHGRIVSGLRVEQDQEIGPIEIALAPIVEGEKPALELTGIGAMLSSEEDALVVGQALAGGGAALVDLGPGDRILAIDGALVADLGFRGAIDAIRGPVGTTVTLTVKRAASDETVDIDVPRRKVRFTPGEER